jgi:hypothetical protein
VLINRRAPTRSSAIRTEFGESHAQERSPGRAYSARKHEHESGFGWDYSAQRNFKFSIDSTSSQDSACR